MISLIDESKHRVTKMSKVDGLIKKAMLNWNIDSNRYGYTCDTEGLSHQDTKDNLRKDNVIQGS